MKLTGKQITEIDEGLNSILINNRNIPIMGRWKVALAFKAIRPVAQTLIEVRDRLLKQYGTVTGPQDARGKIHYAFDPPSKQDDYMAEWQPFLEQGVDVPGVSMISVTDMNTDRENGVTVQEMVLIVALVYDDSPSGLASYQEETMTEMEKLAQVGSTDGVAGD